MSSLLVCLLGVAAAAAGATATGDLGAGAGYTEHNGDSDHGGGRDPSSFNGDPFNMPRHNGSAARSSSSGMGNDGMTDNPTRFKDNETSPDVRGSSGSGLSWQSLLPGSIQ